MATTQNKRFQVTRTIGQKRYEFCDHLSNVRNIITDTRKSDRTGTSNPNFVFHRFATEDVGLYNMYAYGMPKTEPNDYINASGFAYRYGFNGQEKVDEIAGVGNHNSALYWEYDTRLGRRWNVDPVDQVNISNYAVMYNNPIIFNDVLGNAPQNRDARNDYGWRFNRSAFYKWLTGLSFNRKASNEIKWGFTLDQLLKDIGDRRRDPSSTNQGNAYFCWAQGQIKKSWADNGIQLEQSLTDFYSTGVFNYSYNGRSIHFKPDMTDMYNAVNSEEMKKSTGEEHGYAQSNLADQMLGMILNQYFVSVLNLDSRYNPGDGTDGLYAGGTFQKSISAWQEMGFKVNFSGGSNFGWMKFNTSKIKLIENALQPGSTKTVMAFIGENRAIGTHFIQITKIALVEGKYIIEYWDYGSSKINGEKKSMRWSSSQLQINLKGLIIINFKHEKNNNKYSIDWYISDIF
jgi:hypothetical protein